MSEEQDPTPSGAESESTESTESLPSSLDDIDPQDTFEWVEKGGKAEDVETRDSSH